MSVKKCIIVDDNPMARTALRHLARQVPELELVQECNSAAEAFQYLQNNPADLLLLDVEMPEMSGLELLTFILLGLLMVVTLLWSGPATSVLVGGVVAQPDSKTKNAGKKKQALLFCHHK